MDKINKIIDFLISNSIISADAEVKKLKSGTTNGLLYLLSLDKNPTYVVKIDSVNNIKATHEFLTTYSNSNLLPTILHTDLEEKFILYNYIPGETHFNRGFKIDWMTILIKELFNKYKKADEATSWGRINGIPRTTWADFNKASLENAQHNIGDMLPLEDHKRVQLLVNRLNDYSISDKKYYLHGDTGVHNFVYLENRLNGVIDPSPLIGPKIYDFTYAFCSSQDNFDFDTLLKSFALWNIDNKYTEARLFDEVTFQLYTRIGICMKVHPHDLPGYLEAWELYKKYLPTN